MNGKKPTSCTPLYTPATNNRPPNSPGGSAVAQENRATIQRPTRLDTRTCPAYIKNFQTTTTTTTMAQPSSSPHIVEGAVVCDGAVLCGDITIGQDTVVFPGARIECLIGAGPIVIGQGCVVEEAASILSKDAGGVVVGDGNLFEVGCTVCAQQVCMYVVYVVTSSSAE